MSGGRWVKQKNGDYQHYTDEEIAEQEFSKGILIGAAMAIVGPYLLISNINNIGDSFYAGCIGTVFGIICLIRAPKETFIIMIFYAIIGGLIWYFCWPSSSETEISNTLMRNFHFLSLEYYILLGHVAIFNANIGRYGFIGNCMILKYR